MSVHIKKFFHIKHKVITVGVVCGLLVYGGASFSHAKNVQSYHPNVQLLAYRNKLQHNLNQIGEMDANRAKVKYNHQSHHLTFMIEDYDSIRPFEKNIAQHQTNQFRKHTHTKYVTYSIHVLHSAIKSHLAQVKENHEQIKENKIIMHNQKVAAQKEAQKKHQEAIENQKKAKQRQQAQKKKQQAKKHQQNKHHKAPNHHKK